MAAAAVSQGAAWACGRTSLSPVAGPQYPPAVTRLHASPAVLAPWPRGFPAKQLRFRSCHVARVPRKGLCRCAASGAGAAGQVAVAGEAAEPGHGHGSNGHVAAQDYNWLPKEEAVESQESYRWPEAWYPAALVSDLNPLIPKAVTILGRPLVIWWDRNAAKWQVFADECPHRLAPLSEGRIHESGRLQCSYHGWTFGGDGGCGLIPQAPSENEKTSPRACARVVPSLEQQGLLFVWPDRSKGAKERAAASPPPFLPELSDPSFTNDLSSRDMSYGADTLIENLMDPAHVPFAHHGIMVGGNVQGRREGAKPLNLQVDRIYRTGFEGRTQNGPAEFIAPCLFTMKASLPPKPVPEGKKSSEPPKERRLMFVFFCVPTTPGHSKLFFAFPNNFLPKAVSLIPRWFRHLGQLTILDSDMYFLHLQERRLEADGGMKQYRSLCFLPTASDSFVSAYRRWLVKYGGEGFEWGPGVDGKLPPTPPKVQLMDRYHSHVVNCKACSGAKRNFERLQFALAAISFAIVASLAAAAVSRIVAIPPLNAAVLLVLAGLSLLGSFKLGQFIYKSYHFHDYCHALVK